jgi:branched-chain amino acid transport system permease protein
MGEYVQLLVNAATNAAVYSLVAFSLVLVYRGSGVINFGVGHLTVFAGIFFANSGFGGWTALLLALLLGALLGVLSYLVAVWVGERFGAPHAALAMATLGFGLVLEYFAGVFWAKEGFTGPTLWGGANAVAGVTVSHQRMLTVVLAVACFLVILVLLERTMVGWALEAVAFRRETAAAYGVNTGLAMLAVWALAGLVAALGGALLSSFSAVSAPVALPLAVMGFSAAVVGGLGSVGGAVVGAIVVSVAETLFIHYVSSAYSGAFAFLLLFVVLAVRPQGIVGVRRQLSRT